MNCLDAQAHISAAHDGEAVSDSDLTAARAHCLECEECTAFTAGLRYLDLLPVPPAPDGLAERIMDVIVPLAAERAELRAFEAERAEAESVGVESPSSDTDVASDETGAPALEPVPFVPARRPMRLAWFTGPTRWATLGAAGALAATALVAFVVVSLGGAASPARPAAAGSASQDTLAAGTAAGADLGAAAPAKPAPTAPPATAPDCVLYKDFVYAPGALLADSASATPTIGTLVTAFASGNAPATVLVYRSPLTDGSIVVPGPDGRRLFAPVIRMLASVRYQLTSGTPIDRFGVWPGLPTRFPTPSNSAGTPSFVQAGSDALGVPVFSATGRPVTEGFAVAPGTSASDPAGGNPGWTWWAPAPPAP
jgi:hypothetical protein